MRGANPAVSLRHSACLACQLDNDLRAQYTPFLLGEVLLRHSTTPSITVSRTQPCSCLGPLRYKSGFKRAALQLLGLDTYSCVAIHMDVIKPLQGSAAHMQACRQFNVHAHIRSNLKDHSTQICEVDTSYFSEGGYKHPARHAGLKSHTMHVTASTQARDFDRAGQYGLTAQVVLSWRAEGRIHRQVVTRELALTTVLVSYCRDLDVPVAALLLAKGVMQGLTPAADADELAATQDSIGAHHTADPSVIWV